MLTAMPAATAADSPATPLSLMRAAATGWSIDVTLPAAGAFGAAAVICKGV